MNRFVLISVIMLAIIETSGKQYLVKERDKITVNRIKNSAVGSKIVFDRVLLLSDDKSFKVGQPYIEDVKVQGEVLREFKKKTLLWRFRSKTRYRKKQGYKNYFNDVKILKVES